MRVIIHAEHVDDAIMGVKAVKAAVRDGHGDVVYTYGNPVDYNVYVRTNKTGFTAYVTNKRQAL